MVWKKIRRGFVLGINNSNNRQSVSKRNRNFKKWNRRSKTWSLVNYTKAKSRYGNKYIRRFAKRFVNRIFYGYLKRFRRFRKKRHLFINDLFLVNRELKEKTYPFLSLFFKGFFFKPERLLIVIKYILFYVRSFFRYKYFFFKYISNIRYVYYLYRKRRYLSLLKGETRKFLKDLINFYPGFAFFFKQYASIFLLHKGGFKSPTDINFHFLVKWSSKLYQRFFFKLLTGEIDFLEFWKTNTEKCSRLLANFFFEIIVYSAFFFLSRITADKSFKWWYDPMLVFLGVMINRNYFLCDFFFLRLRLSFFSSFFFKGYSSYFFKKSMLFFRKFMNFESFKETYFFYFKNFVFLPLGKFNFFLRFKSGLFKNVKPGSLGFFTELVFFLKYIRFSYLWLKTDLRLVFHEDTFLFDDFDYSKRYFNLNNVDKLRDLLKSETFKVKELLNLPQRLSSFPKRRKFFDLNVFNWSLNSLDLRNYYFFWGVSSVPYRFYVTKVVGGFFHKALANYFVILDYGYKSYVYMPLVSFYLKPTSNVGDKLVNRYFNFFVEVLKENFWRIYDIAYLTRQRKYINIDDFVVYDMWDSLPKGSIIKNNFSEKFLNDIYLVLGSGYSICRRTRLYLKSFSSVFKESMGNVTYLRFYNKKDLYKTVTFSVSHVFRYFYKKDISFCMSDNVYRFRPISERKRWCDVSLFNFISRQLFKFVIGKTFSIFFVFFYFKIFFFFCIYLRFSYSFIMLRLLGY